MLDVASMREIAARNDLLNPTKYWALAAYLILVNSLLEEYVWRWFVFRCAATKLSARWATIFAGACFTIHHFIALNSQTTILAAGLASLGVLAGGLTWSVLYARYGSIWPGYVSHILADISVFIVGYHILFAA
jgi:membrane protease YdiL (CAAX protease family)